MQGGLVKQARFTFGPADDGPCELLASTRDVLRQASREGVRTVPPESLQAAHDATLQAWLSSRRHTGACRCVTCRPDLPRDAGGRLSDEAARLLSSAGPLSGGAT
jgi:hypothetical protein